MQIRVEQAKGKKTDTPCFPLKRWKSCVNIFRFINLRFGYLKVKPVVSIKTTENYTHVTTKGFEQIKSPLDKLNI